MGPARHNDRQAFAAALAPGLAVLVGGAIVGAIAPPWAVAAVALLVAGAWWFLKRPRSPAGAKDATAAAPASGLPADIIEAFPEPVALIDGSRKIVGLNRAARDLLGIGQRGRDLALSLRHPAVLAAVDRVFSGVPYVREEIALPVPVPRTFTLHASRLPSSNDSAHDDPARPAVMLMLHDETRAKRAEQTRADFIANASHELRSPLAALSGIIETLRGPAKGDPEAQARFLDIMRVEAQRMTRLIEDLLSLSRVEINEHVPPRGRVGIEEILDGVVATLTVRADDHGMRIVIDCPEDLPPVVGDTDQLTQVFHNLVDNAVKYGGEGTSIDISVRAVDALPGASSGVEIKVQDHGPGIPDVHLPRVTERFYRVDAGRSRKLGGTGLGLAIAKHIVSRHRGHMRIESTEGHGTTVVVLLPTHPA